MGEKEGAVEGDRRVSIANGGPASRRSSVLSSRRGSRARGSAVKPADTGMVFQNVCVDIEDKRILWDISGKAVPGQMLALMGPSGAGKTTLLNALAGHTPLASGKITLNSKKMSKKMKRQISYVQQADIFFPNLTLRETLRYSALIRLPSELSFREKLRKVEEILVTLRLQDCADTCIGNALVRGLSGGEKKRANIGCELLTSPSLLLLDEPTSGLDSTSALQLLELLRTQLATKENKTIIMSIHQPSSQMYYMFDMLLLLAKGKVAYFGPARDAMGYFSSLGLHCDLQYNPADYMMDLVTNENSRRILIGEDPRQECKPKKLSSWQRALQWFRLRLHASEERGSEDVERGEGEGVEERSEGGFNVLQYEDSPRLSPAHGLSTVNPISTIEEEGSSALVPIKTEKGVEFGVESGSLDVKEEEGSLDSDDPDDLLEYRERKWPTSWWWQMCVLTVRTFRQSRHAILSKTNLFLAISLSIVASLVWFQIPETEQALNDRFGILFFSIIFWSFNSMFIALTAFPAERVVINKERSSGSYRLSAYYLAKTLSELPLILFLPSVYIIVVYWTAGLNGWASFFGTWFFLLFSGFMTQSLGLLISATVAKPGTALTIAALTVLTSMLLGGFYVRQLPSWLEWAENLSFVTFSYDAMLQLEFTDDRMFSCSEEASSYPSCNSTLTGYPGNGTISGSDVLQEIGVSYPLYINFLAMAGFSLLYRVLAYLSLRFLHRP